MKADRTRTTRFLLWCGLVVLALRPVPPVDAALAWAILPLRLVSELASPLRLLERHSVHAAEDRLAATSAEEEEQSVRLRAALARGARPTRPELTQGRRLVAGEVRGRDPEDQDRIRVHVAEAADLVPGLPVVCGDAYVGRLALLEPDVVGDGALLEVELVTAAGFHVGAKVDGAGPAGAPVLCTVGGVVPPPRGVRAGDRPLRLVLHNPSDRTLASGEACVDELFADAEENAGLARGFVLGRVERRPEGRGWSIAPVLDYRAGLLQVVVLAPPDAAAPALAPGLEGEATRWLATRPLVTGDPAPWRETAVIGAGAFSGVEVGAAVSAIGGRLVGRVASVGPASARVSFLGDPGFQVVAVARVDGLAEPLVLGRLVSLGRDPADGSVLLRWLARVDASIAVPATPDDSAHPGHVRAQLFSGSGDPGLESGFFLGTALLPRSESDGRIVRLVAAVDPDRLGRLYVRLPPREETDAAVEEEGS